MLFAYWMMDRPGMAETRQAKRAEHRAYLAAVESRIHLAGPLMAKDGASVIGSLLVVDHPDRAAAEAWIADEPFAKAGVYQSTEIAAIKALWPRARYDPENAVPGLSLTVTG